MYVDRPRPHRSAFVLPLALATFFGVMALGIAALAVIALPPIFWVFVVPVLALCLFGIAAAMWYVAMLTSTEYRVEGDRLAISRGVTRTTCPLDAIVDILPAGRPERRPPAEGPAAPFDWSGIHSARNFANRPDGNVLLNVGGEWIRLSPSDPRAFVAAVEAGRRR
jgi:hypothetical protein